MIVEASSRARVLELEEIAELLSEESSMTEIVRGIVDEGRFEFSWGSGLLYTRKGTDGLSSYVHLGIRDDFYVDEYPQYKCSLDEFSEIMKIVRDRKTEEIQTRDAWKDRRDETKTVEALYDELTAFFHRYKEKIRNLQERATE